MVVEYGMNPVSTTLVSSVGTNLAGAGSYAPVNNERTGVTIVSPTRRLYVKYTKDSTAPAALSSTDYHAIVEPDEDPIFRPVGCPNYIWLIAVGGTATDVQITEWQL